MSFHPKLSLQIKLLPTKVHLVKAMIFPVVMYGCESWTIKKTECWRIDAFELWCSRRFLRVPWTARRSNQSILKEINPEHSVERLMLKLMLQYFGHLMQRTVSLEKNWRGCGEKGTLLYCWWEYKLVQPLWRFLQKLKIELLSCDPAIPLLGIYPEKIIIQKDTFGLPRGPVVKNPPDNAGDIRSLVQGDPPCHGATMPVRHKYWLVL